MLTNIHGEVWGYVRVSTKDQNEDRQLIAMKEYGVKKDHIMMDKQSGKDFNRPAYKKLIRKVEKGDIIVIKSIDRLGRNYQDIIDQWRMITQDIGCGIHVIDMPTLNTSGDPKDLLSRFITDMMLQVLSFVAENERENTKQRQKEGIAAAKRRGVHFGRPEKGIPKEFFDIYIRWKTKETPAMKLYEECKLAAGKKGLSIRTFYRRINELDSRYGNIPEKELRKIIFEDDIEYVTERLMRENGEYTSYNNNRGDKAFAEKDKIRKKNLEEAKRKKEKEETAKRLKQERIDRLMESIASTEDGDI